MTNAAAEAATRTAQRQLEQPTIPHEVSKRLVQSFPPPENDGDGTARSNAKRVPVESALAISEALRLFVVVRIFITVVHFFFLFLLLVAAAAACVCECPFGPIVATVSARGFLTLAVSYHSFASFLITTAAAAATSQQEAHGRALIEAECDKEGDLVVSNAADKKEGSGKGTIDNDDESDDDTTTAEGKTPIGANHITRIAADLLMDFS